MHCKCCGIRTDEEYCSDLCAKYGADKTIRTSKSKYPHQDKCAKCSIEYIRNNFGQKHCYKCRTDRSHLRANS